MRGAASVLACLVVLACNTSTKFEGDGNDDVQPYGDADGDSILDHDEGRDASVDTDGDTIPDWRDDDSDGDGIPDIQEAGDGDTGTPPVDSDADGTPDFRDLDSDGNGVLDRDEGSVDTDSDGVGDHADLDNDGDTIVDVEEIGDPSAPVDTDGDTVPDYKDLDSDSDGIADAHERPGGSDVDGDGLPDRRDPDSDGDGIPDSVEAGDPDVHTEPRDTDLDGTPDFRDTDSDCDGLADSWENENGTDPYDEDSDGDGMDDGFEVLVGTDPLDAGDTLPTGSEMLFVVPYNDPADPPVPPLDPVPLVEHLVLEAAARSADVFFTLDSSGSMSGEIANLRSSLLTTVVPGIRSMIPDAWFGVGRFEDCSGCTYDMAVLQRSTSDEAAVEAALAGWSVCGGYEPYTQDLYALATGDLAPFAGWHVTPATWTCTPPGSIGWPCFRPGALPIIVQFGDEPWSEAMTSCSPVITHSQAASALDSIGARYIGVNSNPGTYSSHADMVVVATASGSVDWSGSPLVFDIPSDGSGLATVVVDAVEMIVETMGMEITAVLRDDPSDSIDVVAEFVDYVEPSTTGGWPDPVDPSRVCVGGLDVADLREPVDGRPDSFLDVMPGTLVCFDIRVKQNWTVPATAQMQLFAGDIDLVGDDVTILDSRRIYLMVPGTTMCWP